jgi:uncharacterized protein (DUF58 family)
LAVPRTGSRKKTVPTERALWVCLLGLLFTACGLIADSSSLLALGSLGLALMPAAWFIAELAQRELARVVVTVSPHVAPAPTGTLAPTPRVNAALGRPLPLYVTVGVPAAPRVTALDLVPSASEGLTFQPLPIIAAPDDTPDVAESRAWTRAWNTTSARLGDAFILGFTLSAEVALGMFRVATWTRAELVIQTLPVRMLSASPHLTATRAVNDSQAEMVHRDKRGFGLEIRELRDFVPGDPFKHIAWRASARRGKLIAREFESDLSLSVWLSLDVSPSMWWGPPGRARIDHALEIASELARVLSAGRDKVGLVIHDHMSRLVVEPGRGPLHHTRMLNALLEVPHFVFEDMTEVTDRELIERVARWWEVQEQRSFVLPHVQPTRPADLSTRSGHHRQSPPEINRPLPRQTPYDVTALVMACREALGLSRASTRSSRPLVADTAHAVNPDHAILRAFCRRFGVALTRDPTPRPGGQAHGLEAALASVLAPHTGKKSSAHTIVALTDLHSADDHESLRRVALTARRHRHGLVFLQPTGERGVLPPQTRFNHKPTERRSAQLLMALLEVQQIKADDTARAVQAILRPAGASFLSIAPGDSLAKVLSRLDALT